MDLVYMFLIALYVVLIGKKKSQEIEQQTTADNKSVFLIIYLKFYRLFLCDKKFAVGYKLLRNLLLLLLLLVLAST